MFDKLRQHVALLALVGVALAISVGIASGIGERPGQDLPPLRIEEARPTVAPVSRDIRSALNLSDAFTSIAASITPGVVRIESEHIPKQRSRLLPGMRRLLDGDSTSVTPPEMAGGSGFIISSDGYIVTNNHVVEEADIISVLLYDKRVLPARLVGRDPLTDIALLKIDADKLPALSFGDSDQSNVGEWVLAIGNPGFGDGSPLDFTVTSGIISAKGRPLDVLTASDDPSARYAIEDFLQTDAAINPGNSGGPLLNVRGEVIGMNTAIASSTGFNQGYAFAIPSKLVARVVKDLAQYGHVRRPLLGVQIQPVTQEDAEVYKLPKISGVLIEDFSENSPARKAGLQRGDIIASVDGQTVDRVGQLQGLIAQHSPGEFVETVVYRDGTPRTFRIRLDQAPLPAIDESVDDGARAALGAGRLGIQVLEMTEELARQHGFTRPGGAVVTDVQPMSAADRKGVRAPLRILSINGKTVRSGREAQGLLRGLRSGQIVSLMLENAEGTVLIRNIRVP